MPIDINNINNNSSQTKRADEQKPVKIIHGGATDSSQRPAQNPSAQDSVNLTDTAMKIKALEEEISRLPIIDTQKVEQIKNSINDGTFEFNSERIAEKLLKFETELL